MQQPNGAHSGHSIWDRVGKPKFERQVATLKAFPSYIPTPRVLPRERWPAERESDILPFEIEKQLCDDISFIAACGNGVDFVTATAVETQFDGLGIIFRVAANEGVGPDAIEEIQKVLNILRRRTQKELRHDECVQSLFDVVIQTNQNRILGRLGSSLFRQPHYERSKVREPLDSSLSRHFGSQNGTILVEKLSELHTKIKLLQDLRLKLELSPLDERLSKLKLVVRQTFELSQDGHSFSERLKKLGFSDALCSRRDVREVGNIANYWRVCETLARLSWLYRRLFSNARLKTIKHYAPSMAYNQRKLFVHAEIQMAIFYETSAQKPWPRVIGVSKEACFLCDAFLQAHGHFRVLKAHRQIFDQWTVPDRSEYSPETLTRLQQALKSVYNAVSNEIRIAVQPGAHRQMPNQSSINVKRLVLPTPSITTLASFSRETLTAESLALVTNQATLEQSSPVMDPNSHDLVGTGNPPVTNNILSPQISADTISSWPVSSSCFSENDDAARGNSNTIPVEQNPSGNGNTKSIATIHRSLDWLSLSAELETASTDTNPAHVYRGTNVTLRRLTNQSQNNDMQALPCFDMADMPPGTEKVFTRPTALETDGKDSSISIVLTKSSQRPVLMTCTWYEKKE